MVTTGDTIFNWLYKAIDPDKVHKYDLVHAYCDGEFFLGTNSARAHIVPCAPGTPAGRYAEDGSYIDAKLPPSHWRKIIPPEWECTWEAFNRKQAQGNPFYQLPNGLMLMTDQIMDAVGEETATFGYHPDKEAYYYKNIILIMPSGKKAVIHAF